MDEPSVSSALFGLLLSIIPLGIGIYLLVLLAKFVGAHKKGAEALVEIARKLQDRSKP